MKILKNAKALSPVIASIILIAVTVAVSIGVGVWLFGLSGSFMGGAEQLKITHVAFGNTTTTRDHFNVTMQNPSSSSITVNEIWVGNTKYWTTGASVAANSQTIVKVTLTPDVWNPGYSYDIKAVTSKGNTVIYPTSAPYA